MNNNPAISTQANIAFDGTTHRLHDVSKHVNFGWAFEVVAAITVDAIFKVVSAPPSSGDPCAPGASADVLAQNICQAPLAQGTVSQFRIPAGTPVGSICAGSVPCRPNAFMGLASVSGTVGSVRAVMVRQWPIGGSQGGFSPQGQA